MSVTLVMAVQEEPAAAAAAIPVKPVDPLDELEHLEDGAETFKTHTDTKPFGSLLTGSSTFSHSALLFLIPISYFHFLSITSL